MRACIVRGIRYHPDFATGAASVLHGSLPLFTRALNTRAIMSNRIPDLTKAEDRPYCIWHPDVPSEDTLRTLVQRCPDMRYNVGRACAVGGYIDLYRELDILPEVAIAEEARESGPSDDIYNLIMAAPARYTVMNDLDRTLDLEHPKPGHLNGNTAIRALLDNKQEFDRPYGRMAGEEGDSEPDDEDEDEWPIWVVYPYPGFNREVYNITEDWNIDLFTTERSREIAPEAVSLLYSPLPVDLPTCDKEGLVLVAAYNGDIDRYARLRGPWMLTSEWQCIVHGICMSGRSPPTQGLPQLRTSMSLTLLRPQRLLRALVGRPAARQDCRRRHLHGHYGALHHEQ